MYQRIIYTLLIVALSLGLTQSCDTWENDLNVNPNYPTEGGQSDVDYNFEPKEFMLDMTFSTIKGWDYLHWNVGSAVCEYHGKTISLSQGNRHQAWHAFEDASHGGPWNSTYDAVRYIVSMREAAIANGDIDYQAIADIWECFTFFNLTLLYGNVPYSEVFIEGVVKPKYDDQEEIYYTLLQKLKAASLKLEPSGSLDASTDLIFRGDLEKWKRFANTLIVRYSMYMYDASPDSALSYLNEILNDANQYPVMESNEHSAFFNYDAVNYYSRYYLLRPAKLDEAPFSNVFVERLISINDPRLPVYAKPVKYVHTDSTCNVLPSNNGVDKYAGHIYGITTDNAYASSWNGGSNYASKLGAYFYSEDASGFPTIESADVPLAMATYSEMLFFLAEATERELINTGISAKEYYEGAIEASFNQYEVNWSDNSYVNAFGDSALSSLEEYLAQQQVDYNGGRDKLTLIAEQKWIASFLMMFEPYFDHRRTMLPEFRASSGALAYSTTGSSTKFPSRAAYPSSEVSNNPNNVAKAKAEGFDIPIVNTETRNEALMWIMQSKDQTYLQMPTYTEPTYKSEYPCDANDAEFGTNFYTWYQDNWNTMFWWKNE